MGNQILTVPYLNEVSSANIKNENLNESNSYSKESPHKKPANHAAFIKSSSSVQIPSECPMHENSSEKSKQNAESGCPIKEENKSDINPNNMVIFNF
jgi:hypothetical protein